MNTLKKLGSVLLGILLLAIIFLAKGGDVPSLLRDFGLSHLFENEVEPTSRGFEQFSFIRRGPLTRTSELASSIDCINRVDGPMRANFDAYRRSFPAAFRGGPVIHRSFKVVPYEIDYQFAEACTIELLEATNSSPTNKLLNAAAMEYSAALSELIPVMRQVDDYLAQEAYRDDDWRLMSDKLHPQIIDLSNVFLQASYKLRGEIDAANLKVTLKRLAEIERSKGRDYSWHQINLIYQARLTLDVIAKASDQNGLAVERIRATEAAFEIALRSARTAIGERNLFRTGSDVRPLLAYLEPRAVTFLTTIKTLRRNLMAGQRAKTAEDLQRITDAYNAMIRDYNDRSNNGQ